MKELIRVRVQYASRQQCCKTHKRPLPLPLYTNNTQNDTKQTIHTTTQQFWKSAGRAPSWLVIPWHLPYNWGKRTEKPQSGFSYDDDDDVDGLIKEQFLSCTEVGCCLPPRDVISSFCLQRVCLLWVIPRKMTIFGAHSQNCVKRLLASSCLSVRLCLRPSVRMEQFDSHWTNFLEVWYFSIFRKCVEKIQVSLKSDKNKWYFTWIPINMFGRISLISSSNETNVAENIKTHVSSSVLFFSLEYRTVYEVMWKDIVQPGRPHNNMSHANCMVDT